MTYRMATIPDCQARMSDKFTYQYYENPKDAVMIAAKKILKEDAAK